MICVTAEGIAAANERAVKAYADRGISDGPGTPMAPGRAPEPQSCGRPYLTEGRAADSPGNSPQRMRLSWRAGVAGDGPVAMRVRDWQAGPVPLPVVPGGGAW